MINPVLSPSQAKRWFIGSLFVAAIVRLYLLWQYYCISSDGVIYLRAAQDFIAGNVNAGLASVYPPGYPLLIAAVYPLIGDWESAGQSLSWLFGVSLLVPLFGMFRGMFAERIALLACYLAAVSPFLALYSAHVRSESAYLFVSTTALYLFYGAIERRAMARFFVGGLVAGYAFLVRPEAIGFLVIVPGVLLWRWRLGQETSFSRLVQATAALSAGFLIFALPYIVYLSVDTGRFGAISRKAGVTLAINLHESAMLEEEGGAQGADVGSFVFTDYVLKHPLLYAKKVVSDLLPAIGVFFQALYYSYLPFLALGLFLLFRERGEARPDLLLIAFVLFYVFGFALIYVKRRYSLQAVPVSLAWVAAGMWCLWDKLRIGFSFNKAGLVAASIALFFLGSTLPKTLKPVSREKAFVRETGWYLKARNQSGTLAVAVFDERVAFYASARTIPLTRMEPDTMASYLREQKADYLAAESKIFEKNFPELSQQPESFGLVLEKSFIGTHKDRMLLYKVS